MRVKLLVVILVSAGLRESKATRGKVNNEDLIYDRGADEEWRRRGLCVCGLTLWRRSTLEYGVKSGVELNRN